MFETTIPFGQPELMRASAYRRYLDEYETKALRCVDGSRVTELSPSLMADLARTDGGTTHTDLLEVMAACVRHAQRVTLHLDCNGRSLPLTIFPSQRQVHCPVSVAEIQALRLSDLQVMHLEPAMLRPPGHTDQALVGENHHHHPLDPLLWELAMRGPRSELLPEIAGPAAYRVNPALELRRLPVDGALVSAVRRLRRESVNLRDLSEWPGMDRDRAVRLLNALYLQAGLIISRTHPEAASDSWFGVLGR